MSERDTQNEGIEAARRGERVSGKHSIRAEANPERCPRGCAWLVLFCNNEEDVVECRRCGAQKVTACSYNEDFA